MSRRWLVGVGEGNGDSRQHTASRPDSSGEETQGSDAVLPVDAIDRGWRLAAAVLDGLRRQ